MTEPARRKSVRVVLATGVVIVIALLALELSGSAPRTAGSDHVAAPVFSAALPHGGVVCQPVESPPDAMAAVRLLIGTYGRPVPALAVRFLSVGGVTVSRGALAPGAREGYLTIPMRRTGELSDAASVCVRVGGTSKVVLAGESDSSGTETIDGKPAPGVISLVYLRHGSESWWQLLPTVATRFGLGKASFFGTWTLPVLALLLVVLWAATLRLLSRELR